MKRETYQRGVPGAKWGIWNCSRKEFQFDIREDIREDTPMLAVARLFQKIGDDAKKWRFEPRQLRAVSSWRQELLPQLRGDNGRRECE